MRGIGRLLAVLTAGMVASMVVAAVAAVSAKRHLVPIDDPEADEVQLVAIFDQLAFRSDARSFRGGTVDCWFGGGAVDLRNATLDAAGATLRLRTIFGGGQIVVPESWRVVNDIVVVAGGVADTRPPADRSDDAPELRLEGVAAFGGFVITSELPAAAKQAMFHSPA
jgi:predicted membrane protein